MCCSNPRSRVAATKASLPLAVYYPNSLPGGQRMTDFFFCIFTLYRFLIWEGVLNKGTVSLLWFLFLQLDGSPFCSWSAFVR